MELRLAMWSSYLWGFDLCDNIVASVKILVFFLRPSSNFPTYNFNIYLQFINYLQNFASVICAVVLHQHPILIGQGGGGGLSNFGKLPNREGGGGGKIKIIKGVTCSSLIYFFSNLRNWRYGYVIHWHIYTFSFVVLEAVLQRCSYENVFWKICSKFTGECPCMAALLKSHFSVGVLVGICGIFWIPYHRNTSGGAALVVLNWQTKDYKIKIVEVYKNYYLLFRSSNCCNGFPPSFLIK